MSGIWSVKKVPQITTLRSAWFRMALAFLCLILLGDRAAIADETAAVDPFQTCAAAPTPTCLLPMLMDEVAKFDEGSSEGSSLRTTSILLFLVALTAIDDIDGALSVISVYPNANEPYRGLEANFARSYARTSQDEAAFAIANLAEDPMQRSEILSMIAQGQAEAGQLTAATATASIIADPVFQVTALAAIGDFEAARALVNQLPDELLDEQKDWGLRALAIALARDGQIAPAQLVLQQIPGGYFQSEVFIQIAQAQAFAGLVPDAIETAQDAGPDIEPQTELLLSLWRINPDPLIVTALHAVLDRTPPGHRHRRFALNALSIVDPAPAYAAEAAEILAATDSESAEAFEYYDNDITSVCAAGRFSNALAHVLAYRPGDAGVRLYSLSRIALCLAQDPLRT